jgi:hypothetical protein
MTNLVHILHITRQQSSSTAIFGDPGHLIQDVAIQTIVVFLLSQPAMITTDTQSRLTQSYNTQKLWYHKICIYIYSSTVLSGMRFEIFGKGGNISGGPAAPGGLRGSGGHRPPVESRGKAPGGGQGALPPEAEGN